MSCKKQDMIITPAMKAGLTGHIWTIEEILTFKNESLN
jgi:hypothetical protein